MHKSKVQVLALALLGLAVIVSVMNAWSLAGVQDQVKAISLQNGTVNTGTSAASPTTGLATASSDNTALLAAILPKGVPDVYGAELGVSFSDIDPNNEAKADATIKRLALLDEGIKLEGNDLNRYIRITNSISCEYCCGVPAITDSEGNAACGCAHSYAMRGVAKYMIQKHGSEFTDLQVLEELGKWKSLFFPDAIAAKAKILESNGIKANYISLASNQYRGIESAVANAAQSGSAAGSGAQVGGC